MTTVRKLLDDKLNTKIHTILAGETVLDALKIMAEAETGAVLVTEDDKIVGIFTERDYARQGEVKGVYAKDTIVRDVMTNQMVMIKPETTLQDCAELMRQYRVRHLPVIENEHVIGIVSIRGLAEALLQQKQGAIVELEKYILGTGYGE
ncbi:MAG: CBS domain-containing protein [Chloroflexi bacterium]|nr:CBS domain-containing protein [Chloroflexota bacterium]